MTTPDTTKSQSPTVSGLIAQLRELLAVPVCDVVCPGSQCYTQPCGPHCNTPYTDESLPTCEKCKAYDDAQSRLSNPRFAVVAADLLEAQQKHRERHFCPVPCPLDDTTANATTQLAEALKEE